MDKMGTDRKNQNDGNGRFSALTKYIDIFDGDNFGTWVIDHENDGTPEHPVHMPFVDYSQDVYQFIKDFGDCSEQNEKFRLTRYAHILEENGLSGSRKSMQDADVSQLDAQCVLAMIMCATRAERFCDGALLGCLADGTIQKCLERLKKIDEAHGAGKA